MPMQPGVFSRCVQCGSFIREGLICPPCRNGSAGRPRSDATRTVEDLRLDQLEVPSAYQRRLKERLVRHIVRNFDPCQVGLLTAVRAGDGRLWLIDGQHRVLALIELGFESALCEVLEGLSLERQAEVFSGRNRQRVAVDHLDGFRADYVAGQAQAVAIVTSLRRHGYQVGFERRRASADHVVCIEALREIHAWGVLDETLSIVQGAWPADPQATQAPVLQGVAAFLRLYADVGAREAARRFVRLGSTELLGRARLRQTAIRGDRRSWVHVAAVLVEVHNHGRRAEQRLQWHDVPLHASKTWKSERGRRSVPPGRWGEP
jgi:hypothetical protein